MAADAVVDGAATTAGVDTGDGEAMTPDRGEATEADMEPAAAAVDGEADPADGPESNTEAAKWPEGSEEETAEADGVVASLRTRRNLPEAQHITAEPEQGFPL